MKTLRIILLALLLWNLPAMTLANIGPGAGSLLSYLTIALLALYYFLEQKTTPNWWILIISLLYFSISGVQYSDTSNFINETAKYIIFVIAGYELAKRVSTEQLFYFLLIASITVAIHALFFPTKFGRYYGVFLHPNSAAFICIYGYALTYGLKKLPLQLLGQFIFTLMGLLTFSRSFIVIWVILNLISLKISIRNIRIIGIGFLIFSSLLVIDDLVGLNNPRFDQLKHIFNTEKVSNEELTSDSRTETWALFYDKVAEAPIFGNGFGTFSGRMGQIGAHNTFLMIIGEAGIIPFFVFLAYFIYLFYWCIYFFNETPYLLMQTIALALFLMGFHGFFNFYYVTFAAMWIQYQIVNQKNLRYTDQIKYKMCETRC